MSSGDDHELSVSEDTDTHQSSVSHSSMSLSKRTLPSISSQGLQQLPLQNYGTDQSNGRYSNQSNILISHVNYNSITKETDDMKQTETHNNNKNNFNIIYDDKIFSKFNKLYKYNNTNTNSTIKSQPIKPQQIKSMESVTSISNYGATIKRINNFKNFDLCFKETMVSNSTDLKRCVIEYKALHKFYSILYGSDISYKYTQLYINKKKTSTSYPKKVRLIMKYFEGEDLDDFLVDEDDGEVGFLYENDFRIIMKKILYQLNICHSEGILHCDIKPNNIRINEQSDIYDETHPNYYDLNLIDFGFAHILPKNKKQVKLLYIKGTPGFIAPETIKNKKYSMKSDMFSIGCVAFFLLTNNYAVTQSPDMDLEDMLPDRKRLKYLLKRENDRNRDDSSRIHKDTIQFVLSCLFKNPSKRPTAKQALKLKIFQ